MKPFTLGLQACGMVTAAGSSAGQTLASMVGKLRVFRKLAVPGWADPFTAAPCRPLCEGQSGAARIATALPSALAETLAQFGPNRDSAQGLELILIPKWFDDAERAELDTLLNQTLATFPGWYPMPRQRGYKAGGSTAAWQALESAYRRCAAEPNLDYILIVALDTLCDPERLRQAAKVDALLRPGLSEGEIPGEAAACVLLTRKPVAGQWLLHRPALGRDAAPYFPPSDQTAPQNQRAQVQDCLQAALHGASLAPEHLSTLASDSDGSAWRARLEAGAVPSDLPHWRCAETLGQIGTATGLVQWAVAACAQRLGPSNSMLSWALDRRGHCAATILERKM